VGGEPFKLRIYAIRDQRPHTPTAKELRYQEEVDRDHARRPDLYPERKAYRSWDYSPSERLTLELCDSNSYRWDERALIKRWRDRKGNTRLEDRLAEAFVWLQPAAVLAREKRLEIEERDRLRAEMEARRERLRERKKKAEKAKDYLDKLAETHLRLERLDRLIAGISARKKEGEAMGRLLAEAEVYRRMLQHSFEEPSVRSSLEEMGVLGDEELVMPSLLEPMPPWSWQDW
jgi:hypothetical protein